MEFQAKIVGANKSLWARMTWVGAVVLIAAIFLAMADGYERYAIWIFGLAATMLIVGAMMARGDVNERKVTTDDLVINLSEIRIGKLEYPMADIQEIDFSMDGYEGMTSFHYYAGDAGVVDGMGNALRFRTGDAHAKCLFFLAGQEDVGKLADLFREFYERRIAFREEFRGQRTFLFEPVTEAQWEDKTIMNGYK